MALDNPSWDNTHDHKAVRGMPADTKPKGLRQLVEDRLEELGLNPFEAAVRGGLERGFINDLLQGKKTGVRGNNLAKLAVALEWTPAHLVGGAPSDPDLVKPPLPGARSSENLMPVYASVEGGQGTIIRSTDPIEYLTRPANMQNVSEGYGLIVEGESMTPLYEPGDVALVNPRLGARRGKDAILYSAEDAGGEVRATVKRIVGFTDNEWHLQQFNPPKQFKLSRKEWPTCHRVVGCYKS